MNNQKAINMLVLIVVIVFPTMLIASTQGKTPPITEDEQKKSTVLQKLTVPQKVGRESARVADQVKEAGKDIASAFKKKRHKNKEKNRNINYL